jgi:hypothetical protein
VKEDPEQPGAVFLFYTDGSGVEAYQSLDAARGDIEAVDVDDGAYALYTDDGRVIEAQSGGRFGQDVLLHVTGNCRREELEQGLREALPLIGLDPHLAASPRPPHRRCLPGDRAVDGLAAAVSGKPSRPPSDGRPKMQISSTSGSSRYRCNGPNPATRSSTSRATDSLSTIGGSAEVSDRSE